MSKAKSGWFEGGSEKGRKLIGEVQSSGDKISPNDVIGIMKTDKGKIIWLEKGYVTTTNAAGLKHILKEHGSQFVSGGIPASMIGTFVLNAVAYGKIVGYQGKGTGRPIYEYNYGGKTYHVAVTVGSNGFIVGANLTSGGKWKK